MRKARGQINLSLIKGRKTLVLGILVLVLMGVGVFQFIPTGLVVVEGEFNFSDVIDSSFNESAEYEWVMGNFGGLKSLRLDGSATEDFVGKVYLQDGNRSYLVFDSDMLDEEGIGAVTGLVTDNSSFGDVPEIVDGKASVDSNASVDDDDNDDKSISIDVVGGGKKNVDEVFIFNLSGSFDWDVDYGKVCTRYDVNDYGICYGDNDCCAFIGMESSGNWNDSFYLTYGRYDSGFYNRIGVQVIYANYSLNISSPYSDIIYSETVSLDAEFIEERIEFKDLCMDSCLLSGLNSSSYILNVEVLSGNLDIDNVRYSIDVAVNVSNSAPVLIQPFENISISGELVINLSSYFNDSDGDVLNFSFYETDNISVYINDSMARLVVDPFSGTRFMYFRASDGYYTTVGNIFSVKYGVKKFEVSNLYGESVATVDDKGDLYLKGSVSQLDYLNATRNSFAVQNKLGETVAYINSSGHMFLLGNVTENADLDPDGIRLEFRGSEDKVVAFIDDEGNLNLKGRLIENS